MKYLLRRIETTISELEVEADSPMIARAVGDNSRDWQYVSYDDVMQVRPAGEVTLQDWMENHNVSEDTLREVFGR